MDLSDIIFFEDNYWIGRGGWNLNPKFFNGPMHRIAIEGKKIKTHFPTPLSQYLDILSFWMWKWKMLSAWREAKISVHCLKPVFVFDGNWLTKTSILTLACRWTHFFNGHVYKVAIFQSKMKKLSCFLIAKL